MILSFVNIRKVPREMLKTSGFALGFQHLPRHLANVNEWKIMFDRYIQTGSKRLIRETFSYQSKKISNDQELIQSDPIPRPQNQKGNN